MTPGSVAMLLGETTGLRVQTTAPSLGAANVRIQGLRGHYSQLLADGLPLYGAQGDSFSLLQVPPLDLGQVEVIKGAASALYGPSALGGVVNLVSRRPRAASRSCCSTRPRSADATRRAGWRARATGPGRRSGATTARRARTSTATAGPTWPGYDRGMLRPRLSLDNDRGTSLLATAGVIAEDREGGTLPARRARRPAVRRVARARGTPTRGSSRSGSRRSGSSRCAARSCGRRRIGRSGRSASAARISPGSARRPCPAPAAATPGSRAPRSSRIATTPASCRSSTTRSRAPPSSPRTRSPSARGVRGGERARGRALRVRRSFSPRLSLLARPDARLDAAAVRGHRLVRPHAVQRGDGRDRADAPPAALRPRSRAGPRCVLRRELPQGAFDLSGTVFGSGVRHADAAADRRPGVGRARQRAEPTRTWGTELIARYRKSGVSAMLTHAWTRSTEWDVETGARREVPLTPRHAASFNVTVEGERWGRFGIEVYYTGQQQLDEDPYLTRDGATYWSARSASVASASCACS